MKKKAEFSKVIITSVSIATALVVIASFVLMFIYGDLSPLTYIISGCFAELASATGFYYWKAKNENVLKIKGYGDNPDTDQTAEQEGGVVG